VKVAAVVVSHGQADLLERSLPALRAQVDELVVVANVPGSAPPGVEAIHNERPLGYAANLNLGFAQTSAEALLAANPDAVPEPGAVAALAAFMAAHERCGVAGPRMVFPDGSPQPSRRRFPTIGGTIVRRTPLRKLVPQRHHFYLDETQPAEPVEVDWMLGGFDEGFRLYGEDIDLQYRALRAGWERWYVPAAVVRHEHQAVTDRRWLTRRTLWHWRGIIRFVRKHPERLLAL
jgi:GT2 family glycosyltransferase